MTQSSNTRRDPTQGRVQEGRRAKAAYKAATAPDPAAMADAEPYRGVPLTEDEIRTQREALKRAQDRQPAGRST